MSVLDRWFGRKATEEKRAGDAAAIARAREVLVEAANKSPKLKDLFRTLADRYGGDTVSRLTGPILFTLGSCEPLGGFDRLRPVGFSDEDVSALLFLRVAQRPDILCLIDLDLRKTRYFPECWSRVKKTFRLSDSEQMIVADAVTTFFGLV